MDTISGSDPTVHSSVHPSVGADVVSGVGAHGSLHRPGTPGDPAENVTGIVSIGDGMGGLTWK